MLVFIQYPVTDLRGILIDRDGKLNSPSWPMPRSGAFMKYSGEIIQRKKGGISGWIGENDICKLKHSIGVRNIRGITVLARHFYHDGLVTAKYEFVFNVRSRIFKNVDAVLAAINEMSAQVKIANGEEKQTMKISGLRPLLKKNYLLISTSSKHISSPAKSWIHIGTPSVFIYESTEDALDGPRGNRKIQSFKFENSNLSYCWNKYDGTEYKIWYMTHSKEVPTETARSIRIALLRLQTEEQSVREVFASLSREELLENNLVNKKRLAQYSDRVRTWQNEKKKKLDRSVSSDEVIDVVYRSFEYTNPGLNTAIETWLESLPLDAREWVRQRFEGTKITNLIIMENSTINQSGQGNMLNFNSQVHIDAINQTFNDLAASPLEENKKKTMQELREVIEQMIKEGGLKEPEAKVLTSDYQDLSKEITSEAPRKNRIESILDGITTFAEKTEKFLVPVQSIAKIILTFFI